MALLTTDINLAIMALQNDDIIGLPTETVYGLAGNIYSEKAIKKIFETKKRPFFNPLYILYPNKTAKTISINSINYIFL
mgnify:CR=1 FL=1